MSSSRHRDRAGEAPASLPVGWEGSDDRRELKATLELPAPGSAALVAAVAVAMATLGGHHPLVEVAGRRLRLSLRAGAGEQAVQNSYELARGLQKLVDLLTTSHEPTREGDES